MKQGSSRKKITNSLVAMSSAAVMAVYAAGYTRTRAAAERLEAQSEERRPAPPGSARPAAPMAVPVAAADGATPAIPASPSTAPAVPSAGIKPPAPAAQETAAPAPAAPRIETAVASVSEPLPAALPTPAPSAPVEPVAPVITPPVAIPTLAALTPPNAPQWKDGTFLGWGTSRHGDIQASVVIEGGRIASATIAQCLTRYSCSVIERLPPQVAQRQSPEVDYVSGATQSTNAFYYAVVDALNKAK
jgi:uncharacterized protein with FMN-binding domain